VEVTEKPQVIKAVGADDAAAPKRPRGAAKTAGAKKTGKKKTAAA
jgi:hypothetical protein